jgi:hypothetical protein
MQSKQGILWVKISVVVTFLVMIAANALANILPINGVSTGEVSDAYQNLFAPAGLTFSIWGLIYVLLAGYVLYHLGFFQADKNNAKSELLYRTGILFCISSLANTAWIFCWHYDLIPLSMLLMAVLLISLIYIVRMIGKEELSQRDKIFVRLPFSVYFGWITVATIANFTVMLVSFNWNGFGIADAGWAVIIIAVGLIIGAVTALKNRDVAYALVLLWAYTGILIKHTSAGGFSGNYPEVVSTVTICIILLIIATVYIAAGGRHLSAKKE